MFVHSLSRAVAGTLFVLCYPTVATWLLAEVLQASRLPSQLSVWQWLAAVPVVYLAWLVVYLLVCRLGTTLFFLFWQKPRRASTADGWSGQFTLIVTGALHMGMRFTYGLPFVQSLLFAPIWSTLILRAYAPALRWGRDTTVMGFIYDPELVELGEQAFLGSFSSISCHAITTSPDGQLVYVSAPVVIGPRAVIGGETLVCVGASIGADAIVEAGSTVEAFAVIPAGEVWGGSPARFLRHRSEFSAAMPVPSIPTTSESANHHESLNASSDHIVSKAQEVAVGTTNEVELNVRQIVAHALCISLELVPATLSAPDCPDWDSLGQMSIMADLQSKFRIPMSASEVFRLQSIPELVDFVQRALND